MVDSSTETRHGMSDLTANEIDALLDEIRTLHDSAPKDEGMTAREIADHFGWNVSDTREWIGKAIRAGKATCIRVKRPRIDGVAQKVPAYRIAG